MQREPTPDLLSWNPPARVLLFPLSRRVGKIRHTADLLSQKSGDAADIYWRQVRASLEKQLLRCGLSQVEADREIRAFFNAVQSELARTGRLHCKPHGVA